MTILLRSTTKMVTLNGVPARIWEGESASGIRLHCYITRVAIDKDEPRSAEFDRELQEHEAPSAEIEAIPLRLIL